MPESNSMLLYRACIQALLTPGLSYDDGFYFYGSTSRGQFHIDSFYDGFNIARHEVVYSEEGKAESRRFLEAGRACLTIEYQGTEYLILHPANMRHPNLKKLLDAAIGDHPIPEDEPIVYRDHEIIWDPFTDPNLYEIYIHLTGTAA